MSNDSNPDIWRDRVTWLVHERETERLVTLIVEAVSNAYDRGWSDAVEVAAEKMDKLNPWAADDLRDRA